MKVKYTLKEIKPSCFLAEFEDSYDMCMTFCRYQEYYESPNPKIRNKDFEMAEFMRWYSKNQTKEGIFTYPRDWIGFNIPSQVLEKCHNNIIDVNQYDFVMSDILCKIYETSETEKYYLIGALQGNERTIRHEVAHALFYLNKKYKKEMSDLVKNLNPTFRDKVFKCLLDIGYCKPVLVDEMQAFLSTGWRDYFPKLKNQDKPFIEVFNKYYND